jgi:hypothetical protein
VSFEFEMSKNETSTGIGCAYGKFNVKKDEWKNMKWDGNREKK